MNNIMLSKMHKIFAERTGCDFDIVAQLINNNDTISIMKLLENDCDIAGKYHNQIMTWSTFRGHLNIVTKLLRCNIDGCDIDGGLILSAQTGHIEVIIALLESGANTHYRNDEALEMSIHFDHPHITIKLLEYGADVHSNNNYALRNSVVCKKFELIIELLEYGADIHCNNDEILKGLQKDFDERLADVLVRHCTVEDYHYFPDSYIKENVAQTKSSATK